MSSTHNTIMLNGKRFDAVSGKVLEDKTMHNAAKPKQHKSVSVGQGKVLDGFTRKPSPSRTSSPAKVAHAVHGKPQPSKTLMRKVVTKPVADVARKQTAPSRPVMTAQQPKIITTTTPHRELRADHIKKSNLISKFGPAMSHKPIARTEVMPVQPAPLEHHAHRTASHASTHPGLPIERILENAVSHEQKVAKKTPRRHKVAHKVGITPKALNIGAGVMAMLIIGVYAGYQNLPNMSLRMASAKAGVHASLPGYRPAGFALAGPIKYEPGGITISYQSNSDAKRAFQVSQRKTEWNTDALLQNFVATSRRAYQTYQDNGKTIYIYEGDNATWVDGGVWYQIEGNASLNSDQLLRIAKSL